MSCTLYIETERDPENPKQYQFLWSVSGEDWNTGEIIRYYETSDRLLASIVNLGQACAVLAFNKAGFATVEIKSDKDGKDIKHGGEHDILHALVCPVDDVQALKYRSLYHEYSRYIGRIKQLEFQWKIQIKLAS